MTTELSFSFVCLIWLKLGTSTISCADWYWSFSSTFVFAEGLHSSSDPWAPSGSLGQSGYTAMLGSSPHINQPGSFSAINAQDRMVCLLKALEKGLNCDLFQKLQSLCLPLQNYPLHGADVNGFHSGSAAYSHSSSMNGSDSILGKLPSSF